MQRDVAGLAARHRAPSSSITATRWPGYGRPMLPARAGQLSCAVADDVVDLGLAEHLVDVTPSASRDQSKTASPTASPALMIARSRSRSARAVRHRLHHRLERGREEEGVRDAMALHQLERAFGREAAAGGDDLAAEVERRQQRVHQAAGPGPVRGRPEHVVRLREPVLAATKPGRLPISAECGISAPFGGPVVPLV